MKSSLSTPDNLCDPTRDAAETTPKGGTPKQGREDAVSWHLVDVSGSMSRLLPEMVKEIGPQLDVTTGPVNVALFNADVEMKVDLSKEEARDVLAQAKCEGGTALYKTIAVAGEIALRQSGDSPGLLTIYTDGLDNQSTKAHEQAAKGVVEELQRRGWLVSFVAGHSEASRVAAALGVDQAHAIEFTPLPELAPTVMRSVTRTRQAWVRNEETSFTPEERATVRVSDTERARLPPSLLAHRQPSRRFFSSESEASVAGEADEAGEVVPSRVASETSDAGADPEPFLIIDAMETRSLEELDDATATVEASSEC